MICRTLKIAVLAVLVFEQIITHGGAGILRQCTFAERRGELARLDQLQLPVFRH